MIHARLRAAAGSLGGAWTPENLFSSGEPGAWYESRPEYLAQNADGTGTVAADGDPVGYMQDLSGNGNHATQSAPGSRPTYRTDGTYHWLDFDGSDDHFVLGSFLVPSDFWQILAYDTSGDTTMLFWTKLNAQSDWAHVAQSGSSNTSIAELGSFNSLHVDGALSTSTTRGEIYNEINGKHISSWNTSTSQKNASWVFGVYENVTGFPCAGNLYGMVWRGDMSASERSRLESYFGDISGVAV